MPSKPEPIPTQIPHSNSHLEAARLNREDGTLQLLRSGSLMTLTGGVAFAMLMTVFGGISVEGAHSNPGWLALILGMTCLPFGLLLLLLGVAKWLRNRGIARRL